MGKSSKHVTVGYWHYMSALFGLCLGPVNRIIRISADNKTAWAGVLSDDSPVTVNKRGLFGGERAEGGYAGIVTLGNGTVPVAADAQMSSLGALRPKYVGITSVYFHDFAWSAMTPYIKPPAFDVQRTSAGWYNEACWYPAKVEISNTTFEEDALWEYATVAGATVTGSGWYDAQANSPTLTNLGYYNVPSWSTGDQPFGNTGYYETLWPARSALYARKSFTCQGVSAIRVQCALDNSGFIYLDGQLVGVSNRYNIQDEDVDIDVTVDVTDGAHEIILIGFDEEGDLDIPSTTFTITLTPVRNVDMNPAHIVYQVLTDPEFGMGYPAADLDDTSFTDAANRLYDEGFGMSLGWFSEMTIEDFVQLVLNHIDATLRLNPATGKFELKLMRADYVLETLPVLNTSNVLEVETFARAAWGDLTNQVNVTYEDYAGNKRVAQAQNLAAIESQGGVVSQGVEFPGLRLDSLAARVAQRELLRTSRHLAQASVTVNRTLSSVRPGDVVNLQWPAHGVASLAMRVLAVNRGTLSAGAIRLSLVEDMFALPSASYITPQASLTTALTGSLYDLEVYKVVEYPYYAAHTELRQADLDAMTPGACFGQFFAGPKYPGDYDFKVLRSDDGLTFEEAGSGDFSAYGYTSAEMLPGVTGVVMGNEMHLDAIPTFGGYGYLGNEPVRVDGYDTVTKTLTLGRGCLDGVPVTHPAGTLFVLSTSYGVLDTTERTESTTVYYRGLPTTRQGTLSEDYATVQDLTFVDRMSRPYPPGLFKINGAAYPDTISGLMTVTWAHRDRTQQLADIIDTLDASVGPETGVTYTLEFYNENGTLTRTASGVTGTTYTWSTEATDSGLDATVALLGFNGANATTVFFDPYGKTWTANGNAQISTAQSKFGGASGYFDGTGDYLTTPSHADFSVANSDDLTIECWIRPAIVNATKYIATKRVASGGGDPHEWALTIGSDSKLYIQCWANGTAVINIASSSTLTANTWYHVAACRQTGGAWELFIDGVSVGTATESATPTSNSALVYIGRLDGDTSRDYSGYIDSFRFTRGHARYTSAFTPPTVEPLPGYVATLLNFNGADAATITSDAAYTRTWTFSGNAQLDTAQKKYGTASLLLDGTGGYISTPHDTTLELTGDFTIEAWVRLNALPETTATIASKWSSTAASCSWLFLYAHSTSELAFDFRDSGGSTYITNRAALGAALSTGVWYHLAVSRQGNTLRFFKDGVLLDTQTQTATVRSGGQEVRIGATNATSPYYLNGWIDDLRITKGLAQYASDFTPPASELTVSAASALNSEVRVTLKAVRDGIESWQEHDWTVTR